MVPIVEADGLVRQCAARFEPTSPVASLDADMTGAHVTILWPFLPPERIDDAALDAVRELCQRHPAGEFDLRQVAEFPGGAVYLPPEPGQPLLELMQAVWQCWPDLLPYGGIYDDVQPHVTLAVLGDQADAIAQLRAFAEPFLPIHASAREVVLIIVEDNHWRQLHRFALGRS